MRVSWELIGGFTFLAFIPGCTPEQRCFTEACFSGPGSTTSASSGAGGAGGMPATSSASGTSSSGGGGGMSSSSSGTAGGGGGTGGSSECGGKLGSTCGPKEYCDFPNELCGTNNVLGTCKLRPTKCLQILAPACGCDGVVHTNSCVAAGSGSDISTQGKCAPPSGKFDCGAVFCTTGTQYCERTLSVVPQKPDTFVCKATPAICFNKANCMCLSSVPCANKCAASPDGAGFVVTCG